MTVAGALALGLGAIILATWTIGAGEFSGVFPNLQRTNPTTAACFVAMGLGLLAGRASQRVVTAGVQSVAGTLVVGVGIAKLLAVTTGFDLHVDQLVLADQVVASHALMAPNTAACFVLLGLALALSVSPHATGLVQIFSGAAIVVAFVALLGYFYGAVGVTKFSGFGSMALPTAIATLAVAIGILAIRPHFAAMGVLTAPDVGGVFARRALPAFALGLVVLGAIRVLSIRFELIVLPLGTSIFVTSAILLASTILLFSARMLSRYDAQVARQNAELERSREAAMQANKAKSTFLASMSHEIRTPLNGVLGFAELLRSSDLSSEQREHLDRLRDAGHSLLAIISDILDLSKIEAGKLVVESVPVSPLATVDSAVSIMLGQIRAKGLSVRQDIAPDLPAWVAGDPTRVRQILLNYLSNAVKFTSEGEIAVSAKVGDVGSQTIRFEVADTGMGIPADKQELLFQDFSQTERSTTRRFGGTGLGLAICRRLAEAMGGAVGVDSAPGKGSRFWFTIAGPPCAPPEVATPVVDTRARPAARSARVLVADDVEINQIVVRAMLTAAGHIVGCVEDGAKALAAVQAEEYDLVLMDMEMPEMDGVAATRAIRALIGPIRDIPIVALTANAMLEDLESCKAAGMNDYLAKPIDRAALLEMVAKWSGGRLAEPRADAVPIS